MPDMPTKKLTEDMVIARTKTSDLSTVKKFNCWGSELSDISVIRRFGNVEVLSLSLNNISTLADFQYCQNLVELYVRRNDIRDLSEICYLQDLPRLRRLLLSENPCVDTAGHLYRLTVIRALPNLEILDTTPVTIEEVSEASKTGLLLEHPLSVKDNSPEPAHYYDHESPPPGSTLIRRNSGPSDDDTLEYRQSPPQLDYHYQNESPAGLKSEELTPPALPKPAFINNNNNLASVANANSAPGANTARRDSGSGISPDSQSQNTGTPPFNNASTNPGDGTRQLSPENGYRDQARIGRRLPEYASDYERIQQYYETDTPRRGGGIPQGSVSGRSESSRTRQRSKTSNLLSAVLCLIPELDWQSLEVVELAIRRRMDELTVDG